MLIGIINNKIEELIFKDIQHNIATELRQTFSRCEADNDIMSIDNQKDALDQVSTRVQTRLKRDYEEPVNARLQALLLRYAQCLCHAMSAKVVEVSDKDKLRYGWDGLADYFLLTMYGEADKIRDKLAEYREKYTEQEGDENDAE